MCVCVKYFTNIITTKKIIMMHFLIGSFMIACTNHKRSYICLYENALGREHFLNSLAYINIKKKEDQNLRIVRFTSRMNYLTWYF